MALGEGEDLYQTKNLKLSVPSWMFQNSFIVCRCSYNLIFTLVPQIGI